MKEYLISVKPNASGSECRALGETFCNHVSSVLTPKLHEKLNAPSSVIANALALEPKRTDNVRIYKNGVCALGFFFLSADAPENKLAPCTVIWKHPQRKPIMPWDDECAEADVGILMDQDAKEALRRFVRSQPLALRPGPTPFPVVSKPFGLYAEIRLKLESPLLPTQIAQLRQHILRFLGTEESCPLSFLAWPSEASRYEISLPVRAGGDACDALAAFLTSLSSLPYPTERVSILPLSFERLARLCVYG